jgi:hypothetical protein
MLIATTSLSFSAETADATIFGAARPGISDPRYNKNFAARKIFSTRASKFLANRSNYHV